MPEEVQLSQKLRQIAIRSAEGVSAQLRDAFRAPMEKDTKRDAHDIVTLHDRAAEKGIVDSLLADYADSSIIGEEGGVQGSGRVHWHIDPIDGTSNFSRGIALWCVSIAAAIDGRVIAGVILDPMTGNVFSADLSGAWLNDEPLHVNASELEIDATIVSSFPNAKDTWLFGDSAFELQKQLIENFQAVRNLGSGALNLAHVAAGWADATMGFYTNSWDIAAGSFILEQAGGSFTGLKRGTNSHPAHEASDYFAIGGHMTYPTLERVLRDWSSRYDAATVVKP